MTIKQALSQFPIVEVRAEEAVRDLAVWPLPHTMDVMYTLARAYYELMHDAPVPYKDHVCGNPNDQCDGNCMDVASHAESVQKAIRTNRVKEPRKP